MEYQGLTLDPFQERAFAAIDEGRTVIVAAPTGAGKTLIAEYAMARTFERGERVVYTAPIKALSNQKFRDFNERFPGRVGILTGDVTIKAEAPILIMTTEIYRNSLLETPERVADARTVVFDEVHFMSDVERGTVWEESILFAPSESRFLCLSATVSNLETLAGWMREVRAEPVEVIRERDRPVPLKHLIYLRDKGIVDWEGLKAEKASAARRHERNPRRRRRGGKPPVDTALPAALAQGHLPALYFVFNRRRCEELAYYYRRIDLLKGGEREELLSRFDALADRYGVSHGAEAARLRGLVERGIAYHHAGLLPTTKEIVEQCFATGRIKLLFATETFAMGVNMPARAVIFDNLVKFDGVKIDFLPCRDFQQMAGRAGRRGKDKVGFVYATLERRDLDLSRIQELLRGEPEGVDSQFNLSYASILSLTHRLGEGLFQTVRRSFGVYQARVAHRDDPERERRAIQIWEDELRAKRAVLARLGYLSGGPGGALTAKGEFARKISGHELIVSELADRGVWQALSPEAANVLAVAVVHEPRKNEWNASPPPEAVPLKGQAVRIVRGIRALEKRLHVRLPVQELCYDLSAAAYGWSLGIPFDRLSQQTSQDPGDLVRVFRQAIQLLRQLREAAGKRSPLWAVLEEAVRKLNRDEVDAERLLRG